MTTIHVRSVAAGVLALFAAVASAAAQTESVLNALEVRQLVVRGEPGDHARLSAHFAALADRHDADATRHEAMARAFRGNPNRQVAGGSGARSRRLAELATQSAATLRELAVHHDRLAAGGASTVPEDAARFEAGEGAPLPTDRELTVLAARAHTPADHRALEEYFLTLAAKYTAEADRHATMAHAYRGTRIAQAASHCTRMVTLSRESAQEATAAAAMHRELAGVGG